RGIAWHPAVLNIPGGDMRRFQASGIAWHPADLNIPGGDMRRFQAMALDAGLHGSPLTSTFLEVI
ncbi:hypothetical protein ACL00X_20665, partial [Aeromonas diversa]|uniref:hypothetical protein n=1 Tax=Aeromonas diversa TaxID=502790 RepID=UPI0039A0B6C5